MSSYSLPLWVYAAIGIVILWGKMKHKQRSVYALTEVLEKLVPHEKARFFIELAVFLSFGCVVSVGLTEPTTPGQAFAAGLGWTSLTSR